MDLKPTITVEKRKTTVQESFLVRYPLEDSFIYNTKRYPKENKHGSVILKDKRKRLLESKVQSHKSEEK